jgi:hypothetical protein
LQPVKLNPEHPLQTKGLSIIEGSMYEAGKHCPPKIKAKLDIQNEAELGIPNHGCVQPHTSHDKRDTRYLDSKVRVSSSPTLVA